MADAGGLPLGFNFQRAYAAECLARGVDLRSGSNPDAIARDAERSAILSAACRGLTTQHQDVIRWRYLDGLTFGAIAGRFNVSIPAVHSMHSRALQRLRESLRLMGVADATDLLLS